jgi:tripartite-type tricarboxylate transporter receptor subunit TctC
LLGTVTGAKFLHVPYKGGGESIKALMGGEIDVLIDSITSTSGPLASGRIKAVAIGQAKRNSKMPDVPTFEESGIQKFSMTHWVGVVAPARTPPEVLATLHEQVIKALKAPEVTQKFQELGATPVGDSTTNFQKFINDELKSWQQTVKAANISAQ